MVRSPSNFISVDWGTSRFRMHLVRSDTLSIIAEVETGQGVKPQYDQWLKGDVPRLEFFLTFLREKLKQFEIEALETVPILISGMASSSIGLMELPYASLPFACSGEDLVIRKIPNVSSIQLYLISGLRAASDVMRGEETILIGLHRDSFDEKRLLYLLPGTHSKHVICKWGEVIDFTTYMTGEIFEVIRSHTILKSSMGSRVLHDYDRSAFREGVQASGERKLLNNLFKVRTRDLLLKFNPGYNYNFLSGLLIGEELQQLAAYEFDEMTLCGSDHLNRIYGDALKVLGYDVDVLSGHELRNAMVRGHGKILNRILDSEN